MFGTGADPRTVVDAVERWVPKKAYRSETKFSNDLQAFLDEELNSGGFLGGGGQDIVVSREYGQVNADVAVDGEVGIELKRDLTNRQKKKLHGQIEEYRDEFSAVIACACGIKDMDGWRDLKNRFSGEMGGMGMAGGKGEVYFVHKRKENFGSRSSGQDDLLGGW